MKKKLICMILLSAVLLNINMVDNYVYAQDKEVTTQEQSSEESQNDVSESDIVNLESLSTKDAAHAVAQELVKELNITGIQYAVMDNGNIILSDSAGVYSKKTNESIKNDTMFGIGSVSKMFTTASIMKLVDEGKVELDSPVTKYLPDFKMNDERYKKITVRMLLNHSSGLMGTEYRNSFLYDDNNDSTYKNLLDELSSQRLKAEPGEYSVYCNDGFSLAQMIVEKISGKDFTTYIHENFTEPLGLNNTKTPMDDFDNAKLAKTYSENGDELPKDCVNIIGAGGIYSTAEDLCGFMQVFNDKSSILSKESKDAMIQNEAEKGIYPDENEGFMEFGLGWDNVKEFDLNRYGIQAVCKGGDTYSYHGSIINIPEYNISVAVLSSGGSSAYDELLGISILRGVLKDKGIIKEILPDKKFDEFQSVEMPEELTKYSGIYMERSITSKVDITSDGNLKISIPGNDKAGVQTYHYTSDGYFTDDNNFIKVKPVKEKNGKVYFRVKQYVIIPGTAESITDYYQLEKVDENENMPESVKESWNLRNGSEYLLLNEKYTSQIYLINGAIDVSKFDNNTFGYEGPLKVVGKDDCISILDIPCVGSRDMCDVTFYTKDNKEYEKAMGSIYVNANSIDNLGLDDKCVQIDDDGYAKWFKIDKSDDKTMTVDLPENGAFVVYDDDNKCINYSLVSKNNTVDLVKGKYIAFMGEKGCKFNIKTIIS